MLSNNKCKILKKKVYVVKSEFIPWVLFHKEHDNIHNSNLCSVSVMKESLSTYKRNIQRTFQSRPHARSSNLCVYVLSDTMNFTLMTIKESITNKQNNYSSSVK